jgi:hypothetical protein
VKGGLIVRKITFEFAHPETLDRARRWLIQVGFSVNRIEAHLLGIPRLAVAVEPGEAAEVEMLIDAVEASDPDRFPSFLHVAQQRRVYSQSERLDESTQQRAESVSFAIAWHAVDQEREVSQASTEVELQRAYHEQWD